MEKVARAIPAPAVSGTLLDTVETASEQQLGWAGRMGIHGVRRYRCHEAHRLFMDSRFDFASVLLTGVDGTNLMNSRAYV